MSKALELLNAIISNSQNTFNEEVTFNKDVTFNAEIRQASGKQRPNVVFFMLDDFSSDYITKYNPLFVDKDGKSLTPTLDAFCDDGMRWSRCYTNAPICQTSRFHLNTSSYTVEYGMSEFSQDSSFIPGTMSQAFPPNRFKSLLLVTTSPAAPSGAPVPGASLGTGYVEGDTLSVTLGGEVVNGTTTILPNGGAVFSGFHHAFVSFDADGKLVIPTMSVTGGTGSGAIAGAIELPVNTPYQVKSSGPNTLNQEFKIMHRYLRDNGYHTGKLMKDNYGLDNTNTNNSSFDYIDNFQFAQANFEAGDHQGSIANFDVSQGRLLDPTFQTQDDTVIRNVWNLNRDPEKPFFAQINDYNVHQVNVNGVVATMFAIITGVAGGAPLSAMLTATGIGEADWNDWVYFSGQTGEMGAMGTFTYMFPWATGSVTDMNFMLWMWATKQVKKIGDMNFKHVLDLMQGKVFDANGNSTYDAALDIYADTLVVVSGDHGSYDPFGKFGTTHHSFNVPLIMKWPLSMPKPAGFEVGGVHNSLVSFIDMYPTFARICKCDEALSSHVRGTAFMDQNDVYVDSNPFVFASRPETKGPNDGAFVVIGKDYMYVRHPGAPTESDKRYCQIALMNAGFTQGPDIYPYDRSGNLKTFNNPATRPFLYMTAKAFKDGVSTPFLEYFCNETPKEALYPIPTDYTYSTHFTNVATELPNTLSLYRERCDTMIESFTRTFEYEGQLRTINFATKQYYSHNFPGFTALSANVPGLGPILAGIYANIAAANMDLDEDGLPHVENLYGLNDPKETTIDGQDPVLTISQFPNARGGKDLLVQKNVGKELYNAVYAKKETSFFDTLTSVSAPGPGEVKTFARETFVVDFFGRFTVPIEEVRVFGSNMTLTPADISPESAYAASKFIEGDQLRTKQSQPINTLIGTDSISSASGSIVVMQAFVNSVFFGGRTAFYWVSTFENNVATKFYMLLPIDLTSTATIPPIQQITTLSDFNSWTYEFKSGGTETGADSVFAMTFSPYASALNIYVSGNAEFTELDASNNRVWYWKPLEQNGVISLKNGESVLIKAEQTSKRDTEIVRYD